MANERSVTSLHSSEVKDKDVGSHPHVKVDRQPGFDAIPQTFWQTGLHYRDGALETPRVNSAFKSCATVLQKTDIRLRCVAEASTYKVVWCSAHLAGAHWPSAAPP